MQVEIDTLLHFNLFKSISRTYMYLFIQSLSIEGVHGKNPPMTLNIHSNSLFVLQASIGQFE